MGEFVSPADIFGDYPYLSSMSTYWLDHVATYSRQMVVDLRLGPEDLVLEIASNDGHLLKGFQAQGVRVLGIEPAGNVAAIARADGVPTETAFFGTETARRVRASHGAPRLITANNVMAHVPDLDDFVDGLRHLCDDRTIVTVENPTFTNLLKLGQFDTIYHEHFSYLSGHAVRAVARRHGLELIRVEVLPTHGGSNRYWMALAGAAKIDDSVDACIRQELADGLLAPQRWHEFAAAARVAVDQLRAWLDQRRAAGDRIVAYGAAAKGNTLLNAAGASADDLAAVTDRSPEKQGRFLPGSHVAIVSPMSLAEIAPDDVLVLPWNIASELVEEIRKLAPQARVWVAIPTFREVQR